MNMHYAKDRPNLLTVRGLCIEIEGKKLLECGEFVLRRGDKVLITSRSGGGKSIFLNCVAGLLPAHWIISGEFIVGADNAMSYAEFVRRRPLAGRTSFIFQDAMNSLHPYRPVSKQLKKIKVREGATLGKDLERFELTSKKMDLLTGHHFSRRLSGGECQRVSLLYATDMGRDLVLLDEPLTDIDLFSRKGIEKLFDDEFFKPSACGSHERQEKTVILVTHDARWIGDYVKDGLIARYEIIENLSGQKDVAAGRLVRAVSDEWLNHNGLNTNPCIDPVPDPSELKEPIPSGDIFKLRINSALQFGAGRKKFQIWPMLETHDLAAGFRIKRGEGIALYGKSGSGKSLLLRCMAGLQSAALLKKIDRKLQAAERTPFLNDISMTPSADLAANIQYIFQNNKTSVILSKTLSSDMDELVTRAVHRTIQLDGVGKDEERDIKNSIEEIIKTFWRKLEIPQYCYDSRDTIHVAGLSLGMLRRYSLIRALIKLDVHLALDDRFEPLPFYIRYKPRLLLADEISRGLDETALSSLASLIIELKYNIGLSIVLVSHENDFINALVDKIFLVVDGYLMPKAMKPGASHTAKLDGDDQIFQSPPNTLNPIYERFCTGDNIDKLEQLVPHDQYELTGCVVKQIIGNCINEDRPGCIAAELKNRNECGVCS